MTEVAVSTTGVYLGQLGHIGPSNAPTGIFKSPVTHRVAVSAMGLEGDVQADRRVHGGLEKAVYHYPAENYPLFQAALPHLRDAFVPGSLGENLSSHGLDETGVHIGDIYRIGSALLQVSQPRRPCWKVNHKFGNAHVAALLMAEGVSGWYYRVLEEGELGIGDAITLQERLVDSVSVRRIWELFARRLENKTDTALPAIPGLSKEWGFQ